MLARLMGLKTISPDGLQQLLQAGSVTVIDVNSPQSWSQARVPGAVNLDPTGFGAGDLPGDSGSTLVFYCSNPLCMKAPKAAKRAKAMGYTDARVMSAGISGWLSAELPTDPGPEAGTT